MDALQRIEAGCDHVIDMLSTWDEVVSQKRSFLSKDIYMLMLIYVVRKNVRNEPVSVTTLEGFLCDRLKFSDKTAKEHIRKAIDEKLLLAGSDPKDGRRRNLVVSEEMTERLLQFSDTILSAGIALAENSALSTVVRLGDAT